MKETLLVVEDESSLLKALKEKFEKEGYEVETAHDGKAGLDKALNLHPDLILLDIVMPEMDGVTTLKNLREDDWGKTAKVIMLSNLSDEEKMAECIDAGVYDYLVKTDWQISDVVEKVREKLEK